MNTISQSDRRRAALLIAQMKSYSYLRDNANLKQIEGWIAQEFANASLEQYDKIKGNLYRILSEE